MRLAWEYTDGGGEGRVSCTIATVLLARLGHLAIGQAGVRVDAEVCKHLLSGARESGLHG